MWILLASLKNHSVIVSLSTISEWLNLIGHVDLISNFQRLSTLKPFFQITKQSAKLPWFLYILA